MADDRKPVEMAVIGAAHGLRGEVRVKSFTGDPLALGDYGDLYDGKGRTYTIVDMRLQKDMAIIRFKGIADRTAADALNGTTLYVDRAALPDDLDEEEFYHADLIGLQALDPDGAAIGRVLAVQDFGAGDIVEISRSRGGSVMVPFTRAAVPVVDVAGGCIVVDPVAAGLMDTGGDAAPGAPEGDA